MIHEKDVDEIKKHNGISSIMLLEFLFLLLPLRNSSHL